MIFDKVLNIDNSRVLPTTTNNFVKPTCTITSKIILTHLSRRKTFDLFYYLQGMLKISFVTWDWILEIISTTYSYH